MRINCSCIQKFFVDINNIEKSFTNALLITFLVAFLNAFVYFTKLFSINATKIFNNKKLFVICFDVNVFKNVNIDYDFRDWNYAKMKILFIENDEKKNVALNIDANIFLKNKNFVKRQNVDLLIRKIIFFIIVRGLNTTQHENINYIIAFMYFFNIKNNVFTKTFI